MRTADIYRALRKYGVEEDAKIFRAAALKRITFQFSDGTMLKFTYWANTKMTARRLVAAIQLYRDKAVKLDKRALWVPEKATVHLD